MKKINLLLLSIVISFSTSFLLAQKKRNKKNYQSNISVDLSAFKFRNIGPAFLSGRIEPNLQGSPSTTKKGLI